MTSSRDFALLLVEHDEPTRQSLEGALVGAGCRNIIAADDEIEALRLLRELPHERLLVLLDLDLAGTAALDFLNALRSDDALRSVPVVALTAGGQPQSCSAAYAHHVAGTLRKPADGDPAHFSSLAAALYGYWSRVEFPGHG